MPHDHAPKAVLDVLLVEDDAADVLIAREALRAGKLSSNLNVVSDGVEAMSYLRRQGAHSTAHRPDLILLDLNLPRKDGREVLAEIKADPSLKRIPVVVLTTSEDERDVLRSYELHANCYIPKPVELGRFIDIVRSIEDFWLTIVTLPPSEVPV